ncbi:MAG TPA: single-stranded DNA-binding protein [Candidatus Marinimicrobia bacterium]|jgi:single-strand DNA-binding protein|nr:single-stranded DNA-binding protein [Candidatus Neomarinimicrobiota bacterium]MDP7436793.1 single-stranded DNA-binding protein [Candidatus Neomarinimicrobiota bacterium]HBN45190.1 single-stranded DNA-binding protein [Candidatus Neomarinimicrobiota bacterium]HJL73816.1 single-stranded DNA-binding protein [Candidatus Neomarinimicrobiota bacterium]HJM69942.1 single-stranded DNA-binding protein [Candidatus Neomarinimicrobiota bacterium]|tara:strand:+ start:923 stop:1321 length:399 start_codon:yes stop_codon:yes gene_type:complete
MQKGSVNKAVLVGHLGADPESRFTPSGVAVTTFNMATNESWKNNEGQYEDRTEWHRVVLFGKAAETANEYMKKGQLAYVEGRIRTRSWEDKEGMTRYTTEILGDRFTMLGRKSENQNPAPADAGGDDDDLPF